MTCLPRLFCLLTTSCWLLISSLALAQQNVAQWDKLELSFTSEQTYDNPLYDVEEFYALFTSPTGRELRINGFWNGGTDWQIRFAPDETGQWSYTTVCSDESAGLDQQSGTFTCTANDSQLALYQHGSIIHPRGTYHLAHHDGTPFFWTACTAWNGALKSTGEEWDQYLQHRVDHHYNTIQFVTTQWRGADMNSRGQVAFEGSGRITINPEFFQHMDQKVDRINEYGLLAAVACFGLCFVLAVVVILIQFTLLPKTAYGRRLILSTKPSAPSSAAAAPDDMALLKGKQGEALTTCSPTGIVRIEGQDYEAYCEDGYVKKGTQLQVTGRGDFRILVRKVDG